jgi:hypothetical protein
MSPLEKGGSFPVVKYESLQDNRIKPFSSLPKSVLSRISEFRDPHDPSIFSICKAWKDKSRNLYWQERPTSIQLCTNRQFEFVFNLQVPWGLCNGQHVYNMCGINEHHLAKIIIQNLPKGQTTANLVDCGAGNFQWVFSLAKYLSAQLDLREDIEINIIGIRGEPTEQPFETAWKRGRLFCIGGFKIEEPFEQFRKVGLPLEGRIDLLVSQISFLHFGDPVGTFIEFFNALLRDKTAFALIDGFPFIYEKETVQDYIEEPSPARRMIELLSWTKAPFLINRPDTAPYLGQCILQKLCSTPRLPLKYLGPVDVEDDYRPSYAEKFIQFERTTEPIDPSSWNVPYIGDTAFRGDKTLFLFLKEKGLLPKEAILKPLIKTT